MENSTPPGAVRPPQIKEILAFRGKLQQRISLYAGKTVDAVTIANLVSLVRNVSPTIKLEAISATFRAIAGTTLTAPIILFVTAKLAGNLQDLRNGKAVFIAEPLAETEVTTLLRIDRVVPFRGDKNRSMVKLSMEAFSGPAAGLKFDWSIPQSMARFIAMRIGFMYASDRYTFQDVAQLSGLFLFLNLKANGKSREPQPSKLYESDAIIRYNREATLKLRCRVKEVCPNKINSPCHRCVFGRDKCAAATHALTFIKATCTACNNTAALMDPEVSTTVCLACASAPKAIKSSGEPVKPSSDVQLVNITPKSQPALPV